MRKILTLTILLLCFSLKSYSQTLHLYGGKNNDEYLGCLNCDKFNSNSIWNAFGNYGSKFNSNSIWNALELMDQNTISRALGMPIPKLLQLL